MSDADSAPHSPPTPTLTIPQDLPTARPYRFTWDPSSRRRGPESVSGTTEGRGGDYITSQPPKLGFLDSPTTATAPSFGALPSEWSSARHGFNAISTVLNHPNKRQAPPKPHSTLPAVPPADLPRVRRKDFDSYLHAIAPEWERYERNTQLGRAGQAQLDGGPSTPRASLSSTTDIHALPSTASHPPQTPIQSKVIPPLDSVPLIFFDRSFNLGDPRTFLTVTDHASTPDDTSNTPNGEAPVDSLALDRLSQYADTVEQHLVKEISLRSTSFFAALTNLHDLQAESEQCLDRIGRMRSLLKEVDEHGAKRGLELVRLECKLLNVNRVQDGVKMVSGVVELAGVAKGLVNAGQWGQALDVIDELERLWQGPGEDETKNKDGLKLEKLKSTPNGSGRLAPLTEDNEETGLDKQPLSKPKSDIKLSSLRAFSALPTHLRDLTLEIAASLSSEIVGVLRIDLGERLSRKDQIDADQYEVDQNLRDRLTPLLHGLVRTAGLKEATLSWQEVVLDEIKGIIKPLLPAFDDEEKDKLQDAQSEARAGMADHLRNMSQKDFTSMARGMYETLHNGIRGLQMQGSVFVNVVETIAKDHTFKSPLDISLLREEFADIVGSAADLAHVQVARVISSRAEQHATLDLSQFLAFFYGCWNFVIECETLCKRMIVGLRGVAVGQAKAFLQVFHQSRLTRSAKLVEDEQWSQTEVSSALQHVIETIMDCAVRDAPELVVRAEGPISDSSGASAPIEKTSNSTQKTQANGAKHLHIEDRNYFLVSATSEVLVLLQDYLCLVINLSLLTTDAMGRVIEFLKAFNSRTCQVVLGAGAMRSAGLKNITAKHLSLASQSLSIMFELIPYVRETFRRHLSPKQAVMLVEFDKLKRDFQEHQNEIHAKLIAIMGDRLNAHVKSLQSVDLSVAKPGNAVNDYIEVLVKETVTLHRVLTRYLPVPTVEYVMTQVLAAINHRLSEEYGKIDIPNQEAKTRLLADAKYLHQKLSGLKHIGTPSSMLETVLAERRIGQPGDLTQGTPPRSDQMPQQRPLSRSSTMNAVTANANQRLRVLLSGRSPTLDKMMGPPRKGTPPPSVPRTSSPSQIQASVSASVTSLLSAGGITPQGLSSASGSTITLVDGGGGGGGGVNEDCVPLPPSGVSDTNAASNEMDTNASSGHGFRPLVANGDDISDGPRVVEDESLPQVMNVGQSDTAPEVVMY
ncbi:vacuolar protein sorting-associated protein 54 [Amanita muscaria]